MVYISKKNIGRLLEAKILKQNDSSFLFNAIKPFLRYVPFASWKSLSWLLHLLSLFLLFSFSLKDSPEIRIPLSLTVPLSFFYTQLPSNQKMPVLAIFQDFQVKTLYTSFLSVFLTQFSKNDLLSISCIISIQSVFFLAAWEDFYKECLSSLESVKVDAMNFVLTVGTVFLLISEPSAIDLMKNSFKMHDFLMYLTGIWALFVFFLGAFKTFVTCNQITIVKLAPLLMMNVNLVLWTQSEVFTEQKNWVFFVNALLGCLLSFKFKVFSAAKQSFPAIHVEVLVQTVFLVLETVLKVIPKYPTFLLLVVFTILRYFSLVFSVTRQVKELYKQPR